MPHFNNFVLYKSFAAVLVLLLCCANPVLAATGSPELERHALAAPAAAESSVPALAAFLTGHAKTDIDKAWVIFRWIADRVSYDIDAYLAGKVRNPNVTAAQVLVGRSKATGRPTSLFEYAVE